MNQIRIRVTDTDTGESVLNKAMKLGLDIRRPYISKFCMIDRENYEIIYEQEQRERVREQS